VAFHQGSETIVKEKALIQLFKNMNNNVGDCFKRWRDVNSIERIRERLEEQIDHKTKENVLKVLDGLLRHSKQDAIREAISKFKINRKIVDIQRNFLKRLLLSKAGLVMIAFKKFQSLPERRKDPKGYDKLIKFERGLNEFFASTMKRSYVALKNEFEVGQAIKKRAVIQLINTTSSGQKKFFSRWYNLT
jgi:hypothetical protein